MSEEQDSVALPPPESHAISGLRDDESPVSQLGRVLASIGARVQIGLRQQGKWDRVHEMYLSGESWEAIGEAIGWAPDAAREWYERESHPVEFQALHDAVTAYGAACYERLSDVRINNLKVDALIAGQKLMEAVRAELRPVYGSKSGNPVDAASTVEQTADQNGRDKALKSAKT